MPKQCYLLIALLLSVASLAALIQRQGGIYAVISDDRPVFEDTNRLNIDMNLKPDLQLKLSAKLQASDFPLGEFPQTRWLSSSTLLNYYKPNWNIEAGYRNLFTDKVHELVLYPAWDAGGTFSRTMQHQGQIAFNASIGQNTVQAYGIFKHLRANPIAYTFDNDFNLISNTKPERGFDDLYYGMRLEYKVVPELFFSAGSDIKQANFDNSDIYSVNCLNLASHLQLKPSLFSRITGDFIWKNRDANNLSPESRNIFQSTLRYQQRIGLQTNGFISFINNSCSDDHLSQFYLISNVIRSHVQYNFPYDLSQGSYLLMGGKYSPEHETSAMFSEGKWRFTEHIYSLLAVNYQLDAHTLYQSKTSYYFSPVSECFLHYSINESKLTHKTSHYIGVGSSINF